MTKEQARRILIVLNGVGVAWNGLALVVGVQGFLPVVALLFHIVMLRFLLNDKTS